MAGGPSQLDLFDDKPSLHKYDGKPVPTTILNGQDLPFIESDAALMASPLKFNSHGECGTRLSELLPHLGTIVDDIAVVRSMQTDAFNHAPAQIFLSTGHLQLGRPSMGAWVTYGLGSENNSLPGFVVMWDHRGGPVGGAQNWTSGFLPAAYQGTPFRSQGEPIIDIRLPAGLTPQQQKKRLALLARLNARHLEKNPAEASLSARIQSYELAYRMQMSAPEAVDLDQETAETQTLYGLDRPISSYFGRQCLLARRLVERGVRFVQIYSGGADQQLSWDAHSSLRANLEQHCPEIDQPVAGLIKDLERRGLLDETLIVWGGEFGRMPTNQGTIGRDHNPRGFTTFLAGGGVRGGMTYGATDEFGYAAEQNPVSVHDLHATCLHLLGMDHEQLTYHHRSREMRLTDVAGIVLDDILA